MATIKHHFDQSTASRQSFDLPTDVIKYIIKGSNALLWIKLIKSCKYFYTKQKSYVLNNTMVFEDGSIEVAERHIIKFWETVNEIPCELYLAGKLTLSSSPAILMPKIKQCDLRELIISGITLVLDEFKFLVESDALESFVIRDSNVTYANKSIVPLEDIFAALPNVTSFSYQHTNRVLTNADKSINAQTFHRMAETSRNRKLLSIYFQGITGLNADDLVLFIRNHAARHCKITLKYVFATTPQLKTVVDEMIKNWEPQSTKPSVTYIGPHQVLNQLHQQIQIQLQHNQALLQQHNQQLQHHEQQLQIQRQRLAEHQRQLHIHHMFVANFKRRRQEN